MKKKIAVMVFAIACMTVSEGCGGDSNTSSEKGNLTETAVTEVETENNSEINYDVGLETGTEIISNISDIKANETQISIQTTETPLIKKQQAQVSAVKQKLFPTISGTYTDSTHSTFEGSFEFDVEPGHGDKYFGTVIITGKVSGGAVSGDLKFIDSEGYVMDFRPLYMEANDSTGNVKEKNEIAIPKATAKIEFIPD